MAQSKLSYHLKIIVRSEFNKSKTAGKMEFL